jgi:hypothetical protein
MYAELAIVSGTAPEGRQRGSEGLCATDPASPGAVSLSTGCARRTSFCCAQALQRDPPINSKLITNKKLNRSRMNPVHSPETQEINSEP